MIGTILIAALTALHAYEWRRSTDPDSTRTHAVCTIAGSIWFLFAATFYMLRIMV